MRADSPWDQDAKLIHVAEKLRSKGIMVAERPVNPDDSSAPASASDSSLESAHAGSSAGAEDRSVGSLQQQKSPDVQLGELLSAVTPGAASQQGGMIEEGLSARAALELYLEKRIPKVLSDSVMPQIALAGRHIWFTSEDHIGGSRFYLVCLDTA